MQELLFLDQDEPAVSLLLLDVDLVCLELLAVWQAGLVAAFEEQSDVAAAGVSKPFLHWLVVCLDPKVEHTVAWPESVLV